MPKRCVADSLSWCKAQSRVGRVTMVVFLRRLGGRLLQPHRRHFFIDDGFAQPPVPSRALGPARASDALVMRASARSGACVAGPVSKRTWAHARCERVKSVVTTRFSSVCIFAYIAAEGIASCMPQHWHSGTAVIHAMQFGSFLHAWEDQLAKPDAHAARTSPRSS